MSQLYGWRVRSTGGCTNLPSTQIIYLGLKPSSALPIQSCGKYLKALEVEAYVPADNRSSPLWLGVLEDKDQYDFWVARLSAKQCSSPDPRHSQIELKAFKSQITDLTALAAQTLRHNKATQKKQREIDKEDADLGIVQRYLDIHRNRTHTGPKGHTVSRRAADRSFEDCPIFISIDVELYEQTPKVVTEIGIAVLDPGVFRGSYHGADGANWRRHIKANHIRVAEYAHLVNRQFVRGCPTAFEFGVSDLVPRSQVAAAVSALLRPDKRASSSNRPIVIVGHDIMQDVRYLQQIGIDILNRRGVLRTFDTAKLFRAFHHPTERNIRGLAAVLNHFDIEAWFLHNAGNDAVYTMWALLAIASNATPH